MSELFWRPSDEQRRTILLMEVAGLFHDVGIMVGVWSSWLANLLKAKICLMDRQSLSVAKTVQSFKQNDC